MVLDEPVALERWLSSRSGSRVRVVIPKQGDKRRLLELVARNAPLAYETRFGSDAAVHRAAVEKL